MTTITKRFIDLAEIAGLRLQCANPECGVALLIEESQFAHLIHINTKLLYECPSCKSSWTGHNAIGKGSGFDPEIKTLLAQILKVREINGKMGCRLTFELKPEAPE